MATKVKWAHVYDDNDGKYVGFFVETKDAKAWIKSQKGRNLRLSDERPVAKQTQDIENALDAALAAVSTKAEEATDAVPPAGETG
jgi:hypothetical protein